MKTWEQMTTEERTRGSIMLVVTMIVLAFIAWSFFNRDSTNRPAAQAEFEAARADLASRHAKAGNPILADDVLADARRQAAAWHQLTGGRMDGWTGLVHRLEENPLGPGIALEIRSDTPGVRVAYLTTINVGPDDPAWQAIKQLVIGSRVRFSGTIEPDKVRGIKEMSVMEANGMRLPEFKFKVSDIESR